MSDIEIKLTDLEDLIYKNISEKLFTKFYELESKTQNCKALEQSLIDTINSFRNEIPKYIFEEIQRSIPSCGCNSCSNYIDKYEEEEYDYNKPRV